MHTPVRDEPPRWVEYLLRVFLKSRDRETIVGDLFEEYREVACPTRGRFRAQLWYVRQALSLVDGVTLGNARRRVRGLESGLHGPGGTYVRCPSH
jgi:hypothetical protein